HRRRPPGLRCRRQKTVARASSTRSARAHADRALRRAALSSARRRKPGPRRIYTPNHDHPEISQDTPVKLTVIGCSPAWPNAGGAQSGYLVEGDGRLLLDCGPGVLARLRATDGWPRVDAVVITHFHLDHWGDLVPWIFGAAFGPGREVPKPELWLPPGGSERLRAYG